MEHAARVGSKHIAALPTPDRPDVDLRWAADRYRDLIEMGLEVGVIAAIEFVGFFQGVHRLGQAMAILCDANHEKACLVCDTFHLYRGGSMYTGIKHLNGKSIAVCHFNDAPADPPQFEQGDADRVLPGDGVLPLVEFVRDLKAIGFAGPLSLELFNRELWDQDPRHVARMGIERMRAIREAAEA